MNFWKERERERERERTYAAGSTALPLIPLPFRADGPRVVMRIPLMHRNILLSTRFFVKIANAEWIRRYLSSYWCTATSSLRNRFRAVCRCAGYPRAICDSYALCACKGRQGRRKRVSDIRPSEASHCGRVQVTLDNANLWKVIRSTRHALLSFSARTNPRNDFKAALGLELEYSVI